MPVRTSQRRRRAVRDLRLTIERLDLDAPSAAESVLPALQEAFDLQSAVSYRLAEGRGGLEFFHESGRSIATPFRRQTARLHAFRPNYDPANPQASQRNRVVVFDYGAITAAIGDTLRPSGLEGAGQIRALLCEGDSMLAWFGGFSFDPVSESDALLFAHLVEPMRRRLSLERRLGEVASYREAFSAALESLDGAAFLVDESANVAHANTAGRALFDASPRVVQALREALAGRDPSFRATAIAGAGRARFLVVAKRARPSASSRATDVARSWRLTHREGEVLNLLAAGEATKVIADRLGCATRTVEAHTTSIFRKARVDGRMPLLAKMWRD